MELISYVVDDMPRFVGGVRELHKLNICEKLLAKDWRHRVGNYTSCEAALARAKEHYDKVEPCPHCCYEYCAPKPEPKVEIVF